MASDLRGRRSGRGFRKLTLVVLMLFAALVAPVALPIRILVERVRRDTRKTEQVVHRETRTALGDLVREGACLRV